MAGDEKEKQVLPFRSARMTHLIMRDFIDKLPMYASFSDALCTLFKRLCDVQGVTATVDARVKTVESLSGKLKRKPQYMKLVDVPDLVGVRIIVRYLSDIESISTLIESEFDVHERPQGDFSSPDSFGYKSRHFQISLKKERSSLLEWRGSAEIRAEVQVRTILQHAWANISHSLDYKSEDDIPASIRRDLYRVSALLESGDEAFEQFRARVTAIRSDYSIRNESNLWRELPLDIDGLRAGWQRLPLKELTESVIKNHILLADNMDPNPDEVVFPSILALCRKLHMQTMGDLNDSISYADVQFFSERLRESSLTPKNISVVLFLLLTTQVDVTGPLLREILTFE